MPAAGRKRDTSIDASILSAAVDLYASSGWAAFTFESVARAAGVGKPAVYRRFDSREQLLGVALSKLSWPLAADKGSLRADLEYWSTNIMLWWKTPAGAAFLRWQTDIRYEVALASTYDMVIKARVDTVTDIPRRAIVRGELRPGSDYAQMLEMISGAILTRVLATPWGTLTKASATRYVASIVNAALKSYEAVDRQNDSVSSM